MKMIYRLIGILIFFVILTVVIGFARGYRIDLKKQSLTSNGILAISSSPKAAKVFINGTLKGVTDLNLTLPASDYTIEIKKEGYSSFSRQVKLKGELVMSVDAILYPINPSFSPLTNLGIVKVFALDQTEKYLLFSASGEETTDGIYLFDSSKKPISFFPPLKLLLLKNKLPANIDFSKVEVDMSPDFKQAIITFDTSTKFVKNSLSYLISLEDQNSSLFDVTSSRETLIDAWNSQKISDKMKILETFPKSFTLLASDSADLISFSPDETKLLYKANGNFTIPPIMVPPLPTADQTPENRDIRSGDYYVYDKKEDKNYEINLKSQLPNTKTKTPNSELMSSLLWYPDSVRLMFTDGKKISVIDYDNTDVQTVYSGPFEQSFYSITSDGNIILLINLNPDSHVFSDLYLVGIR